MKNDYAVWSERGDQHAHRYLLKAGEVSGSVPRLQTHTASERIVTKNTVLHYEGEVSESVLRLLTHTASERNF